MAKLDFILQAVTTANHIGAIKGILRLPKPTRVLVSVAYVKEHGLDAVATTIKRLPTKPRFYVGIRNGVTSIQAIKRLLGMKVEVYAVDTASRKRIFHPKLYFAANATQAGVIIGSANLTLGGLHNNIEASTRVRLDLSSSRDKEFADRTFDAFTQMLKKHPRHVFRIRDRKHVDELFKEGRLVDEEVIPAPSSSVGAEKGKRDNLPPMSLTRAIQPSIKPAAASRPVKGAAAPAVRPPTSPTAKYLVWESSPLAERDLNIPSGAGTNPTGSMGLKKGALKGIDQRNYFRDKVFARLKWTPDRPPKKWERAHATFELVIKNVSYGSFDLKLSHNTNRRSRTYRQRNFMTQLHWADAKKYVANRALLGRVMYLYRKDTKPPEFTIEID